VSNAHPVKGRSWLRMERDKKYGVVEVPVRIEVAYDFPVDRELLDLYAKPDLDLATEQWERLGDGRGHKYQRMWNMPVRWTISQMPTREELDRFNMARSRDELKAVNVDAAKPKIVLNAILTFIAPLVEVNTDEAQEYTQAQRPGFNDDVPGEFKEYLNELAAMKGDNP